jgi:hypothetical protein
MAGFRKLAAVAVLFSCFCALMFAQGGATGAISGTVQDAFGAAISPPRACACSKEDL